MKLVFISHPIGGDIEANLADLRRIIRIIAIEGKVQPFVPYYADVVSLDDNVPSERALGMKHNKLFFDRFIIDEMWLTGPRISKGMEQEIIWAKDNGIVIIDKIGKI